VKLDPKRTALLTLDFQMGTLGLLPGAEAILPNAARAVEFARKQQYLLIHVGIGFAEGYPELSDVESVFKLLKQNNLFVIGTPSAEFHGAIARPDELVIRKQRVGAFSENQLHMILRARGIENLVFFGITTSGIPLSTRAFDLDYSSVVLMDACFDADEEVHRLLTGKVFPAQATVLTVDDFIAEQESL
jgi:nicotinamidase-related amidase